MAHTLPALALAAGILVPGMAPAAPARPVRTATAGADARARASERVTGACRDAVLRELSTGRRREALCERERRRAGRAASRMGMVFGYVISRDVDLREVRMSVARAVLCRRWPLRSGDGSVLRAPDIAAAGCRTRRVTQPLTVTMVRTDGARHEVSMRLVPDRDGRVTLSYGALDLQLRAAGLGTLHDFSRVELGDNGWAGTVDLVRLQEFRAGWHLRWVRAGRGAPELFAARYPEHPAAGPARALGRKAALARQRAALDAIVAGTSSAAMFLVRYPDSPFAARARALSRATAVPRPSDSASPGG